MKTYMHQSNCVRNQSIYAENKATKGMGLGTKVLVYAVTFGVLSAGVAFLGPLSDKKSDSSTNGSSYFSQGVENIKDAYKDLTKFLD